MMQRFSFSAWGVRTAPIVSPAFLPAFFHPFFRVFTLLAFVTWFLIGGSVATAQVGIGTTEPNPNAVLDVSTDIAEGGLLIPRVVLTSATAKYPPGGEHVMGMIVYNYEHWGTGPDAVSPGFYYNSGSRWIRIAEDTGPQVEGWSILGNAGTESTINFLGTTDDQPLRFRTNNLNRLTITSGDHNTGGMLLSHNSASAAAPSYSWIGRTNTGMFSPVNHTIGFTTNGTERFRIPNANQVLGMNGGSATAPFYSWNGRTNTGMYSPGANQVGFSTNGAERFRIPNANQVHAMSDGTANAPFYSWNTNSGLGIYRAGANILGFSTNGNERMRINSDGRVFMNSNTGFSSVLTSIASGSIMGIATRTLNGTALYGDVEGVGDGVIGLALGNANNTSGVIGGGNPDGIIVTTQGTTGVIGTGNNLGIFGSALNGTPSASNTFAMAGRFSLGTNTSNVDSRSRAHLAGFQRNSINDIDYYGGYFEGGYVSPAYAYVGVKIGARNNGINGTNYKIIGNGNVSTLVNDNEGNKRILFAPEAPEVLFEDYGIGQLNNGKVYIQIDPLFSKSIHVSDQHPLKIFIQLEGECNGVYVTEKSANGFWVKELNGGTSNVPFSYHLVANRADDIAADGSIVSKHVGLRFPIGPERLIESPLEIKQMKKTLEINNSSQIDRQQFTEDVTNTSSISKPQFISTIQEQSQSESMPAQIQNNEKNSRFDQKK